MANQIPTAVTVLTKLPRLFRYNFATFALTTEKKKIMEKIFIATVLYTEMIGKIRSISQKFLIMKLYPKYISDKFLTFF